MSGTTAVRVRVTVTDVWDTVTISAPPDMSVRDLKARALAEATGRRPDPDVYVVKYRGAPVLDERRAVADLGLVDGAPLIVLPGRRLPVR